MMVAYALCLRPVGFVLATCSFLFFASVVLGERKYYVVLPIALTSAFAIWYIVHHLLGVYLSPWPADIEALLR